MKDSTKYIAFSILMALASLSMLASVLRDLTTGQDTILLIGHMLGAIICIAGAVLGYIYMKKEKKSGD
ncbi:MAG: hypothetical protein WBZ29_00080 [Methanocella sp.]